MMLRVKKGNSPKINLNLLDLSATIIYTRANELPALLRVLCKRGWLENKMPCRRANVKQGNP